MNILKYLLAFIPISLIAHYVGVSPTIIFILAALSIIPLTGLIGQATEEISCYTTPKVSGFLNGTFGNITELIISIFALKAGLFDVVKCSIAGSVIGNMLFVLGCSMFIGGLKHKTQTFNKNVIEITSSMLLFAVIGLCIPALFTHTMDSNLLTTKYEDLSIIIGVVMISLYIFNLIFSFYTHKDLLAINQEEKQKPEWSLKKSIMILIFVTITIAIESELLVSGIEPLTKSLGLSQLFVGMIIIPIVGNVAEHTTGIIMAMKNKMDVSIEIAIGSSLQIILFVTPVLIFISQLFSPMSIVFNEFELVALVVSVLIANRIAHDGKSNWLEGVQLLGVYFIIAASFFIL